MEQAAEIILKQGASALGLPLSPDLVQRFATYARLLHEWNSKINLTSLHAGEDVVRFHFLDSLTLVASLPERPASLVDVGTGAGFPGMIFRADATGLEGDSGRACAEKGGLPYDRA